jgi:hypothetical protein
MAIDLPLLQTFVAAGITQSVVRLGKAGKNVSGMGSAAREFCSAIDLRDLPQPLGYPNKLDKWTKKLQSKFPKGGQHWGTARKCMNIFMRDAIHHVQLRKAYPSLGTLENVLEVPLDRYVATGLLKEEEAVEYALDWDAIIRLTPDVHGRFQNLAEKVADRKKVARVDLDIYYFRQN